MPVRGWSTRRFRSQAWLDDAAIAAVIGLADGDARRCLNLLQQLETAAAAAGVALVDAAFAEQALAPPARRFDKGGDAFYDQISALHKSVRGSHPDAALYWLTRMLDGGADPRYLIRRMWSMAWDDIGLADRGAVHVGLNAARAYERLGKEEGQLALAQAAVYLSVAEKSNAGSVAFGAAMACARQAGPVMAPGNGDCWPTWYRPVPRGLEQAIGEKLGMVAQRETPQQDPLPPAGGSGQGVREGRT